MNKLKSSYLEFEQNSSSLDESSINYKLVFQSMCDLVETLTFSDAEEIKAFLKEKNQEDILSVPFWFRTLAFKLLVLKNPDNKNIDQAINDLMIFGEEWADEIAQYEKMKK